MNFFRAGICLIGSGLACAAQAFAQSSNDTFVRGGLSYVDPAEDIELSIGGAPVPGAGVEIDSKTSLHLEVGRYVTDAVSLSLSFSGPYETDNVAGGTLAGAGIIATDTFGVMTGGAQWHFNRGGTFSPYVGGGLAYFHVFDVKDGMATNADIDSAFGGMLQAGVEARIADRKALFVDVRRMFLDSDSTGLLGGAPVLAASRLDPLIVSAGVSFEF